MLNHCCPVSSCDHFPGAEAPTFVASLKAPLHGAPQRQRRQCQPTPGPAFVGKPHSPNAEGAALAGFGGVRRHKGLGVDSVTSRPAKPSETPHSCSQNPEAEHRGAWPRAEASGRGRARRGPSALELSGSAAAGPAAALRPPHSAAPAADGRARKREAAGTRRGWKARGPRRPSRHGSPQPVPRP